MTLCLIFASGGMTFHAIRHFLHADAFFHMLAFCFGLIVFMTVVTGIFGIRGRMTGFAGEFALFAMIEGEAVIGQLGGLPGNGRMAILTRQPKHSGMNDRFFVTGHTFTRRAYKHLFNMAIRTFQDRVLPFQRPNNGMVKVGHLAGSVMAAHTIGAKLGRMIGNELRIGFSMTSGALGIGMLKLLAAEMASLAGKRRAVEVGCVFDQAKTGADGMIEWFTIHDGRKPAIRHMAFGTIGTEQPLMDFWFFVTADTFLGCAFKTAVHMALFASRFLVDASQSKNLFMVGGSERSHRVQSIMTKEAIVAVGFAVAGHEGGVSRLMAVSTSRQGNGKIGIADVAAGAVDGQAVVIALVFRQTKVGYVVIKAGEGNGKQIKIAAPMIEMAVSALFNFLETAVYSLPRLPFLFYTLMARFASIRFNSLERRMTIIAIAAKLGMVEEIAYRLPAMIDGR